MNRREFMIASAVVLAGAYTAEGLIEEVSSPTWWMPPGFNVSRVRFVHDLRLPHSQWPAKLYTYNEGRYKADVWRVTAEWNGDLYGLEDCVGPKHADDDWRWLWNRQEHDFTADAINSAIQRMDELMLEKGAVCFGHA